MSVRRLAQIGPLLVLLPACGYSARIGPQVAAVRGDVAMQVSGTLAPGFTSTSPQTLVAVPLTVAAGARPDNGAALTMLETGIEYSSAFGDNALLGYRFGPRVGAITSSPGGGYVGLKGGPQIALEERHGKGDVINLTVEGFANLSTADPAMHTYGVCISFGTDSYSSLGLPHGRPLRDGDRAILAAPTRGDSAWSQGVLRALPDVDDLDWATRAIEGTRWLEDARMEHASIATFAKLALDLLGLGAPPELVDEAHRAARDETKHARICYAIASAYLGEEVGPDRLPVAEASKETPTFERLAVESLVDGCYGEAMAAELARVRARAERDPVIKKSLRTIAREETRHAALAWKIVDWCLAQGGESVREAVRSCALPATRTASSLASSARRSSRRLAPSRTA